MQLDRAPTQHHLVEERGEQSLAPIQRQPAESP